MHHSRENAERPIGLKRRFFLIALPLVIGVNLIFHWFYTIEKQKGLDEFIAQSKTQISRNKERIETFSQNILSDLKIVLNHHELLELVEKGKNNPSSHLLHDLLQFAKFEQIYDQIRFIDAEGMEVIRINFNGGRPVAVGREKLQAKKDRYYFTDTMALKPNEIFISPMDLNIENGEIEIPIKPMIRIATPVFNRKKEKKGILIFNYMSQGMLDALSESVLSIDEHNFLINSQGYFFKGIAPEEEWRFMYPQKKQTGFHTRFPGAWEFIRSEENGILINDIGVFVFDTINPLYEDIISSTGAGKPFQPSLKQLSSREYQWKIVNYISKSDFEMRFQDFGRKIMGLSFLFSLILTAVSWLLSLFLYKKRLAEFELKIAYGALEQTVSERVKELKCLYKISQLRVDENRDIQSIMDAAMEILPLGFRFPKLIRCRIKFKDIEIRDPEFNREFYVLSTPLALQEKNSGVVEVTYGEKKENIDHGPFQKEEQDLIDAVAKQLSGIFAKIMDIREKEKLRDQLLHAQKMEAVGQLAGGIAHDFNNILTIINGFAELGQICDSQDPEIKEHFGEILSAGRKAANLTRHLLAFSRKDAIQPKSMDMNQVIHNALTLLRRLIGDNIAMEIDLLDGISRILADSSQIDQVVFNLVINARDAINEKKGNQTHCITINTREIYLDKTFVREHLNIAEGDYVLLEVTDTGIGMSTKIQEKIFTPFFSTKAQNRGTGLGLATVYGIVRQNKGTITVYSEEGMGTAFKVYWPVFTGEAAAAPAKLSPDPVISLKEVGILVVEDEPRLNRFACSTLEKKKALVFSAGGGQEAIQKLEREKDRIDLLFTDIMMPGMNGRELSDKARQIKPGIKTLYTSGYTKTFFSEDGILPSDILFLKKPYSVQELYKAVGKALTDIDPILQRSEP